MYIANGEFKVRVWSNKSGFFRQDVVPAQSGSRFWIDSCGFRQSLHWELLIFFSFCGYFPAASTLSSWYLEKNVWIGLEEATLSLFDGVLLNYKCCLCVNSNHWWAFSSNSILDFIKYNILDLLLQCYILLLLSWQHYWINLYVCTNTSNYVKECLIAHITILTNHEFLAADASFLQLSVL